MSWTKRLCVCAASMMIAGSVVAFARQAEPATQPSDTGHSDTGHQDSKPTASKSGSSRWGFAPYNKLSSVTEEQKRKIDDIHRRANAEIKAIKDKEEADVMAVLTDEQKTELEKMEAERKAKAAEKRKQADKQSEDKDK